MVVEFEELEPLTDPEEADHRDEVFRRLRIRRGDPELHGELSSRAITRWGSRTRRPWDRRRVSPCPTGMVGSISMPRASGFTSTTPRSSPRSGWRPTRCGSTPPGWVAPSGREDLNLHIHLCLLALRTGKPVKMAYRAPSRSPATSTATRPGCGTGTRPTGRGGSSESRPDPARRRRVRLVHHGGGGQRLLLRRGPLPVRHGGGGGVGARTNNPPCGAMRGFGAVQSCLGYESQMDRLRRPGHGSLDLRRRNALGTGDVLATTGQAIDGPCRPSR